MARELSKNPTVLIVNDTIFAHGGVMPVSCFSVIAGSPERFSRMPDLDVGLRSGEWHSGAEVCVQV